VEKEDWGKDEQLEEAISSVAEVCLHHHLLPWEEEVVRMAPTEGPARRDGEGEQLRCCSLRRRSSTVRVEAALCLPSAAVVFLGWKVRRVLRIVEEEAIQIH